MYKNLINIYITMKYDVGSIDFNLYIKHNSNSRCVAEEVGRI